MFFNYISGPELLFFVGRWRGRDLSLTHPPLDSHHRGERCVSVVTKGCSLFGGLIPLPTLDSQLATEWSELTG